MLASDVLYSDRVAPLIQQALSNAGITDQPVSASQFLPDVSWLTPASAANLILGYIPQQLGGSAPTGSNGHELVQVAGREQVAAAARLRKGETQKLGPAPVWMSPDPPMKRA